MKLTNKQEEGLKIAVDRYKHREPYTCIAGYAGTGKAQPVDTMIPTPNGPRKLGDIKVGDYVFDRLGNPTEVLGVYPQGMLDCYKITLSDGRYTYCNDQHLWSYYYSHGNPKYNHKLITKTLREMINMGIAYCNDVGGRIVATKKYKIPVNRAVFYEQKQYEVDPYVIGAFLGDGCCRDQQLGLSSADEDIVREVAQLIGASSYKKREQSYTWHFYNNKGFDNANSRKEMFSTQDILGNFPSIYMKYSYEKSIPDEYKYGSVEQRFALIQGLMDTDGSIVFSDKNHSCHMLFTSTSKQLVSDFREVINSLGYLGTITTDKRSNKYSVGACYTVYINVPHVEKEKFFRLKRKLEIADKAKKLPQYRRYDQIGISNIEQCDCQKEMICIYVDNPEHLYLTDDYIVTHNTTLVNHIIESIDVPQNKIAYCAYTGRAAMVLAQKGCPGATTAHKLLYHTEEMDDGTYIHTPKFSPEKDLKLIVVDEVSMLEKEQWEILMRWKIPVICLGDPAQLPPIHEDNGVLERPHIFLDEVMRQAQDSEIIRLSMDIRDGKYLNYFKGKDVRIIPDERVSDKLLITADIVLCGKNATRRNLNRRMRQAIWGDKYTDAPINGDKCICLKNYWNEGNLTNGSIGTIQHITTHNTKLFKPMLEADFISDTDGYFTDLHMDYKLFTEGRATVNADNYKQYPKRERPMEFDYAQAITVHKSQGSEYDKVVVFNEYLGDRDYWRRWAYTAITRSKEKLVIVI